MTQITTRIRVFLQGRAKAFPLWGWIVPLTLFLSAGASMAGELRSVSFIPHWLPQAQFAGYYVAKEKGFYAKQGIALTILRGGPDLPAAAALAKKKADVCTLFLSEALQERDKNVRLINIGQILPRSGFILVAKKDSGISHPRDLNGRKVSLWQNFQTQPRAFSPKDGITVTPVVQGATVNLFLRGGVDAASAMWYNEYHTILNAGLNEDELIPFFFDQHDLNFPEDGLYVLEETWRRDRQLWEGFARASLDGWRYAFDHLEEALDIVLRYMGEASQGGNRVHQKWMLARMKDLMLLPEGKGISRVLHRGDYETVIRELQRSDMIRNAPPYEVFCGYAEAKP